MTGQRSTARDPFLDTVRAVSIVRVVAVHLLGPVGVGMWVNWAAPGMPLVFFVAGALAFSSLESLRRKGLGPSAFWKDRFCRLLVPYWVFAAAIISAGVFLAAVGRSGWTLDLSEVVASIIPAGPPVWSLELRSMNGHLWFLATILTLFAAAPGLVWLYRRWRWAPLSLAAALWVLAAAHDVAGDPLGRYWRALAVYAVMFAAGFLYTDRTWKRPRWLLPAVFAVAFPVAVAVTVAGLGRPANTPAVGLPVALSWLVVALAARPGIVAVAERFPQPIAWVSARSLTMYLWGWPTTRIASRTATLFIDRGSLWWDVAFVALALGFLAAAMWVFSPVERWAASLSRKLSAAPTPATSPS